MYVVYRHPDALTDEGNKEPGVAAGDATRVAADVAAGVAAGVVAGLNWYDSAGAPVVTPATVNCAV